MIAGKKEKKIKKSRKTAGKQNLSNDGKDNYVYPRNSLQQ